MATSMTQHPGWRSWLILREPVKTATGFSIIEMMTVMAVAMLLATGVISLNRASQTYKLAAVAKEIEGQIQNTRFAAINTNRSASLLLSADGSWYYLDADGSGTVNGSERAMWAPAGGYSLNSSASSPVLSATVVGTTAEPAALPNRGVAFSPRGSVMQVNSSQVPTNTKLAAPGVIYIRDPNSNYAAVTITSAGRVRSWVLSGVTWR